MTFELDWITVRRLRTMLNANLISYEDLQPWAEAVLLSMEKPPMWLCNLATQTYSPDVSKSLHEHIRDRCDAADCAEMDDEYLASLYLRFERHELSWASFLALAGVYADRADGTWVSEEFFQMLDEMEDVDFSPALARRHQMSIESKLRAAIGRIRLVYEKLRGRRRRRGR